MYPHACLFSTPSWQRTQKSDLKSLYNSCWQWRNLGTPPGNSGFKSIFGYFTARCSLCGSATPRDSFTVDPKKCHSSTRLHSAVKRPGTTVQGLVEGACLSFSFRKSDFFKPVNSEHSFLVQLKRKLRQEEQHPPMFAALSCCAVTHLQWSPPSPAIQQVYPCALWRAELAADWDNKGHTQAAASPSPGCSQ